jgi:hypothetical protein
MKKFGNPFGFIFGCSKHGLAIRKFGSGWFWLVLVGFWFGWASSAGQVKRCISSFLKNYKPSILTKSKNSWKTHSILKRYLFKLIVNS